MANSKGNGPAGTLVPPLRMTAFPPRSCGPTGWNDAGAPTCTAMLGDTEGPTGWGDHAAASASHPAHLSKTLELNARPGFHGSPTQQAKSLLAPKEAHRAGDPWTPLASLPRPLDALVGTTVLLSTADVQAYLTRSKIGDRAIGGPLSVPIRKDYFVIHDSSAGLEHMTVFPPNMDRDVYALKKPQWSHNKLAAKSPGKGVHAYINRLGDSITVTDFANHKGEATRFEIHHDKDQSNFVDIELVQPRLPQDPTKNARYTIAPAGGFMPAQLQRLALLYIAASVRRQMWLVPGYHKNVDPDGHRDDPKYFDLDAWATDIQKLIDAIEPSRR